MALCNVIQPILLPVGVGHQRLGRHIQIPLPAGRRVADVKQRMARGVILRLLNIDRGADEPGKRAEASADDSEDEDRGDTGRLATAKGLAAIVAAARPVCRRREPPAGQGTDQGTGQGASQRRPRASKAARRWPSACTSSQSIARTWKVSTP